MYSNTFQYVPIQYAILTSLEYRVFPRFLDTLYIIHNINMLHDQNVFLTNKVKAKKLS